MYQVIKDFHDLQDGTVTKDGTIYHKYEIGDFYPRRGAETTPGRIAELSGSDNRQGVPLIEEVKEIKGAKTRKTAAKKTAKKDDANDG